MKFDFEKAKARYNNIMEDIACEHLTLDTPFSCKETIGWNIRDMVSEAAYQLSCYYEYAVPVSVIYGTVKMQSDYDSGHVDGDRIGLMQLTREEYDLLSSELGRRIDSGLLFDPKTNIEIGAYKLSKLFTKYQSWRAVYAAIFIGEDTVDEWLIDEVNLAADGTLETIPDEDTEKFVKKFEKTVEIYRDLYESAN